MASSRDDEHRRYMLEAMELVQQWASEGYERFVSDRRTQWAILRGMQTVTEAATLLSAELKARHPAIPWRAIAGYRTIVVHGYLDRHSLELSWAYVESDLPVLRAMVEAELAS